MEGGDNTVDTASAANEEGASRIAADVSGPDAVALLKEEYRTIYDRIVGLDSSCIKLSLAKVLDQLCVERNGALYPCTDVLQDKFSKISSSSRIQLNLHDLSGVGLYTAAWKLANEWAMGKLWNDKLVVVLPIERMDLAADVASSDPSVEKLLRMWGILVPYIVVRPSDVIIIFSGFSCPLRNGDERATQVWINYILEKSFHYLVVSNSPTKELASEIPVTSTVKLSLAPLHLRVTHLRSRPSYVEYSIPAKTLLEEASKAVNQCFFHERDKGTIQTYRDWHKAILKFMQGENLQRGDIKVDHVYQPLKAAAMVAEIRQAIGRIAVAGAEMASPLSTPAAACASHSISSSWSRSTVGASSPLPSFSTPAEWFCAALTVVSSASQKYACYRVSNHLIVRNLSNQYVAVVDCNLENPNQDVIPGLVALDNQFIALLDRLIREPGFQEFGTDEVVSTLKRVCRETLAGEKMQKRCKSLFQLLGKTLKKNDPEKGRYKWCFSAAASLSYRSIQADINKQYGAELDTATVRRILKGEDTSAAHSRLMLGLAATLLGETTRYPVSFLSFLCLLDLSQLDGALWKQAFAHASHVSLSASDFRGSIVLDIAATLGGYQCMSHANSFRQVDPSREDKPVVGLHWVDFKAHLSIAQWLKISASKDKAFNPHLEVGIEKEASRIVLTNLLLDPTHKRVAQGNIHVFDRIFRRLQTFDYMLFESPSLADEFPTQSHEIRKYFASKPDSARAIRVGLPEDFTTPGLRQAGDQSLMYSCFGRLVLGCQSPFEDHDRLGDRIKGLLRVLEIDPDFFQVHYFLAKSYFWGLKDNEQALTHVETFIQKWENTRGGPPASDQEDFYFSTLDGKKTRSYWNGAYSSILIAIAILRITIIGEYDSCVGEDRQMYAVLIHSAYCEPLECMLSEFDITMAQARRFAQAGFPLRQLPRSQPLLRLLPNDSLIKIIDLILGNRPDMYSAFLRWKGSRWKELHRFVMASYDERRTYCCQMETTCMPRIFFNLHDEAEDR
ncbi:hypothetical protein DFJ77DRAFT_443672 [Powellomyces hirtus]|nr:hypothetical protein DFJ77DRAFT_443672 [Powellomyces hirtus]